MSDEYTALDHAGNGRRDEAPAGSGTGQPEKPGLGQAMVNARILLRRSNRTMLLLWVAVVVFSLWSVASRIALGQSFVPSEFVTTGTVLLPGEVFFEVTKVSWCALAIMAVAFGLGRSQLLDVSSTDHRDEEVGLRKIVGKHIVSALGLALFYHVSVYVGVLAFVIPGVFIAILFLPALYQGTAGGMSAVSAFRNAPGYVLKHWRLHVVVVIGVLGIAYGLPVVAGVILGLTGTGEAVAALDLEMAEIVAFSAGFVTVLAVQYLLFLLALGALVAIDEFEKKGNQL